MCSLLLIEASRLSRKLHSVFLKQRCMSSVIILNLRSVCHTLSNALDTSRSTVSIFRFFSFLLFTIVS